MAAVRNFEKLAIFQNARDLSKKIYPITRRGEFKYDTRFVQQIRAAASSIMDNIAEGFEKTDNKEFLNFSLVDRYSSHLLPVDKACIICRNKRLTN